MALGCDHLTLANHVRVGQWPVRGMTVHLAGDLDQSGAVTSRTDERVSPA